MGYPRMKRSTVGIGVLLALGSLAEAQLPRPFRRSKDDHFQPTRAQHDELALLVDAWVECLSPHIRSIDEHSLRSRLAKELQNQYSDHAAWDFREQLIRILAEDMRIDGHSMRTGGYELLGGGPSVEYALVDELLQKAVDSSGGLLAYDGLYAYDYEGTATLAGFHDQVLRRDPEALGVLHEVRAKPGLSAAQRRAARELAAHYSQCFVEHLPVIASRQTKASFREMLVECCETLDSERAVTGMRSKLAGLLRKHYAKGRSLSSLGELAAFHEQLMVRVDEHTSVAFWEKLEFHHREMMADPQHYGPVFALEVCRLRDRVETEQQAVAGSARPGPR